MKKEDVSIMKRKLISALLVSVMTISLAACGTGGGSSEGGERGSGSSEGGHKLTVYAWDPAFNIPAIWRQQQLTIRKM